MYAIRSYSDVLGETFDKTNLGETGPGDVVNLEQALALGDTLGGHIVTGHVDNTGTIAKVEEVGRDKKFTVECSRDMLMLMVYKGSIAIDGISLTRITSYNVCYTKLLRFYLKYHKKEFVSASLI